MFRNNSDLQSPGEYGLPHKPEGWVQIHVPEWNQVIYLASQTFADKLAQHFNIPPERIVSLNQHPDPIPEIFLPGPDGINLFKSKLEKIRDSQNPVIIHCKQGLNRTPVGAAIYLIDRGIKPEDAVARITTAYQTQRKGNFQLNSYAHYTLVLEEAGMAPAPRKRRVNY